MLRDPARFERGRRRAAQGDHPPRPARDREDAARARRRGRGRGPVLQRVGLGVRRGLLGARLQARSAPCSRRRARPRRRWSTSTRSTPSAAGAPGHASSGEREQTLDQLLSEMDGFANDPATPGGGARLDEPAGGPRPGPDALGAVRPQDRGRAARPRGPAGDPRRPPARASAVAGHRRRRHRRLHGGHGGGRSGRAVQRGLVRGGPGRHRRDHAAPVPAGAAAAGRGPGAPRDAPLRRREAAGGVPRDGPRARRAPVAPLRPGRAGDRDPPGAGPRRDGRPALRGPLPGDPRASASSGWR